MPSSLRSFTMAVVALCLTQFAFASPVPTAAVDCRKANPTLPTTTGGPTPLPNTTLTLQYVALGRGIQNYTCTNTSAVPVALGAIATLYDATLLADTNESVLNTLPALAVQSPPTAAGFVLPAPFNSMATLGHHFFDAAGTPTFDLASVSKILYGKKNGDVLAPADASKGPAGTGAVDWLSLIAKPGYTSVGLGQVYRVETAGGAAPAVCPSVGVISVQYSAEYWFYD